jgi:SAM-dependent methyltransferase
MQAHYGSVECAAPVLSTGRPAPADSALAQVQDYWNRRIHDQEMSSHPPGSPEFFRDLDEYRFDKLRYFPQLVDFAGYRGRRLLEVGCGIGTDLVRFAGGGAFVTGIDLSPTAIDLARKNVVSAGVSAELRVADGEELPFPDGSFDVVYAHGVLQYTPTPERMVKECRRVLDSGGEAVFMVYNRHSWLPALSKVMKVPLEHQDAPSLQLYTQAGLERLLSPFGRVSIVPERFPVRTRLHQGIKGWAYNYLFVDAFNLLPRSWVRPLGWHLMAFCRP